MLSVFFRILGIAGLILGIYWAFLFFMQRRIMFPAPFTAGAPARPADAQAVWLQGPDGDTEAWWLPPLHHSPSGAPLLLFGHGNGELIDYWPEAFAEPRRWGMAVLLVEYPGYGRSAGRPSEKTIRRTFRAAYDWAAAEGRVDPSRIVGYGRSLGGGAVAALSRDRSLAAVILESSFTSTRPFARRFGAPGFLVRDLFDNVSAVQAFEGPILIIHGADDEIIPVQHGRTLAGIHGAPIHELPCGHNDCPPAWGAIRSFLTDTNILLDEGHGR